MDENPLTERLSWIAGIVSAAIAAYLLFSPTPKSEEKPDAIAKAPEPSPVPEVSKQPLKVGGCTLDASTTASLEKNGLLDELVHLCSIGRASTVGQTFRVPELHADERFQYFNPSEFNNLHGLSDGRITKIAVRDQIAEKISFCFRDSFDKGASPLERIDTELECLGQQGLKAQDKSYFLLVEAARSEGRNVPV